METSKHCDNKLGNKKFTMYIDEQILPKRKKEKES